MQNVRSIKVDMWLGSKLTGLKHILCALPDNDWIWCLLFFYGSGNTPKGEPMADFESKVRESPTGIPFSWIELKRFADGLDQTSDCLVAAAPERSESFDALAVRNGDYRLTKVVIEGRDSTYWEITLDDSVNSDRIAKLAERTAQRKK